MQDTFTLFLKLGDQTKRVSTSLVYPDSLLALARERFSEHEEFQSLPNQQLSLWFKLQMNQIET